MPKELFTTVTCQQCGSPFFGHHTRKFCSDCRRKRNSMKRRQAVETVDAPVHHTRTINRNELAILVAGDFNYDPKNIETLIANIFHHIGCALAKGQRVFIPHFGFLQVKQRKPRKGVNPRTGESIDLPASKRVVFIQSKSLKEALNKCSSTA